MFGHMNAEPILRVRPACPVEDAVVALIKATDEAQAVRWVEFPSALLVFVIVTGDPDSGAFYVLDRKSGTWLWVDFEDEQYGGYSIGDFEILVREYDLLSLVERPSLLKGGFGWLLRPGKPAETVATAKCSSQGTC
ncbi:MAG TPA: hypothetical protein VH350_11225 [Candidatus Sulfotelmatobacter sp.]|jgi:hypothetical protein|nr:hypothetical protein [Candidatus Sulfotelmatobacter sp.]